MTRGQSRQQLAFETLLEAEDDEDSMPSSSRKAEARRANKRKPKLPNLTDRGNAPAKLQFRDMSAETAFQGQPVKAGRVSQQAVKQLTDIFEDSASPELLVEVLRGCNGSVEAATEALFAMLQGARAQPAASGGQSSIQPTYGEGQTDLWDMLPQECKLMVLQSLSSRELAMAAHTCKDFAGRMRQLRSHIRQLHITTAMKPRVVFGKVAAHVNARAVVVSDCRSAAMALAEPLEELLRMVAEGSAARIRGSPVQQLRLANMGALTNTDLKAVLEGFPCLRHLDLTRCTGLSDQAWFALANYRHSHGRNVSAEAYSAIAQLSVDVEAGAVQEAAAAGLGSHHQPPVPAAAAAAASSSAAQDIAAQQPWPALGEVTGHDQQGSWPPGASASLANTSAPHLSPGSGLHAAAAALEATANGAGAGADTVLGSSAAAAAAGSGADPAAAGDDELSEEEAGEGRAGAGVQGLECLILTGCSLSRAGLRRMLGSRFLGRTLQWLDISECGAALKELHCNPRGALRVLRVFGLPNLLQVHILLPATAPLKILELGRCPQLHTVKVNAAHMKVFSASDCERLTTVQLRTPQLLNLTLALARRLSEVSLEVACPELLHLNVSGCRNLMWEGLQPLVQAAPALLGLNVNGCIHLARLLLPSNPGLLSLDVSGCGMLRQLDSSASTLQSLTAHGCENLHDVQLQAKDLQRLSLINCPALQWLSFPTLSTELQQASQLQPPNKGAKVLVEVQGCTSLSGQVIAALLRLQRSA